MSADDRSSAAPAPLLGELVRTVPRLVDRTRSQAELARSLAGLLPCIGGVLGRRPHDVAPGVPEHERVDVLSVLEHDAPAGSVEPSEAPVDSADEAAAQQSDPTATSVTTPAAAPHESELPIQDYDSLAASQVVPRLATLTPQDLQVVQRYEQATRNRQTILNRVDQLLSD